MVRQRPALDWHVVTVLLLGVLLGIGAWTLVKLRDVATLLSQEPLHALQNQQEEPMQQLTSTWLSGGVSHTITTTRNTGESVEDWIGRHDEALEAAQQAWPVDPK